MSASALEALTADFCQLKPYSGRAGIQDLPNEILEYVFCFLNIKERIRSELVCRRWRDIGANGLWSYPTKLDCREIRKMELQYTPLTNDVMSSILSRCGRSVRQLQLAMVYYAWELTSQMLNIVGDKCPNLVEIMLQGLPADDGFSWNLINLANKCKKLKTVKMEGSLTLNDDILCTFLKSCHSLDNFYLSGVSRVSVNFIHSLKQDLKGFYLHNTQLNFQDVVEKLMERCDLVEELSLTDQSRRCPVPTLMKVLLYYRNTLKYLSLRGHSIKPSEWYCIPDMIPHIEVLSLQFAVGVDDHLMKILATKCLKLKALNLRSTNITDVGALALGSAPSLTELNLAFTEITGQGIESLAIQRRLEKLYFANKFGTIRSKLEEGCISLAKCCPDLRVLILTGNANITNRLVEEINSLLERGLLKGPVFLYIKNTNVTTTVKLCHKLELCFSFPEQDVFSKELNLY